MTDKLKILLAAIAAAVIAIGVALNVYISSDQVPDPQVSALPSPLVSPSPTPAPSVSPSPVVSPKPSPSPQPSPSAAPSSAPSPSPSPSVKPSPIPSPSVSAVPSPTPSLSVSLYSGMTDGFEFVATQSVSVPATAGSVSLKAFEIKSITTTIPTYKGAPVGQFEDLLQPVTTLVVGKKYWMDVTASTQPPVGKYSISAAGVTFEYNYLGVTTKKAVPIYMEMQFAAVSSANGLADQGSTWAQRVALNKQYAAILRAHGIEPIKQWAYVYPDVTNTDFKSIVLDGAIAPPCLFGPSPQIPPSIAQLQSYEAAIKSGALPAGTWAYAWDEGEGDAAATAAALDRVKFIKQYAPSLRVMITRQYDAQFAPYVDIFVPIVNFYNQPGFVPASAYAGEEVWLYASCMSANRCNNATSAAAVDQSPTKFPVMAIDAPLTEASRFVTDLVAAGAKGLLYYNTTESIVSAAVQDGQYKFGNQGDGNYFYPNLGYSKRLKYINKGLNKTRAP